MTLPETWRPVVGYEGFYEVSDLGRVRSLSRVMPHARYPGHTQRFVGRILRPGRSAGYPIVNLSAEGRQRVVRIHQLVTAAFLGPRPVGAVVCHQNGDRLDNRLANLRYDTVSANNYDTARHGNHWQASKTHCKHGHEYTPENTIMRPEGHRRCRACTSKRDRERVR